MKLGVSTHIHVHNQLDTGLLRGIKDAGFETVELYANRPHWPGYDTNPGRREVAGACADLELTINSVHSPFFRSLDEARAGRWLSITSSDADVRSESVDRIVESAALAEFTQVGYVIVHLGEPGETPDGGTWDRLYYSLDEILSATNGFGIRIALENITNDVSRGHQIAEFLAEAALRRTVCCYDCGHATLYRRTVEELREMAPWLATTHIHDTSDGLDNHLIPFEGDVDWQALAAAFAEVEYDGALVIEAKDDEGSPESLRKAAEAGERLRAMIAEAGKRE